MSDKKTQLSITLKAVDHATAPIRRAISRFTAAATAPARALSGLYERTGLSKVTEGIKGIGGLLGPIGTVASRLGSVLGDLIGKIPVLGAAFTGVIGAATAGMLHLVDKFDELGKKSAEIGVSADFLAGMRYAAQRTGVDIGVLNSALTMFSVNVGKAKGGTGRLVSFLQRPDVRGLVLLRQLKAAKSNEEAFEAITTAMGKLTDPAKRSALAQMAFGNAMVAPLFAQGATALKALRDEYTQLGGPQAEATKQAAAANDELARLHASVDGLEAGLVTGLAPALGAIVKQLTAWFAGHRADVAAWAKKFGAELPGAISKTVDAIKGMVAWTENAAASLGHAYDQASKLLDKLGGIQDVLSKIGSVLGFSRKFGPLGLINRAESDAANGGMSDDDRKAARAFVESHPDSWLAKHMRADKSAAEIFAPDLAPPTRGSVFTPDLAIPALPGPDVSAQARAALTGRAAPDDVAGVLAQVHAAVAAPATATAAANAAAAAAAAPGKSEVHVQFENVPKGTRIKTGPQGPGHVEMSVGWNMRLGW